VLAADWHNKASANLTAHIVVAAFRNQPGTLSVGVEAARRLLLVRAALFESLTRTTRVKKLLLTTAAIAAMTVSAHAALDCGPSYTDFGPQKGSGVVRTSVVYEQSSRAWSVQHTLANGTTVEAAQAVHAALRALAGVCDGAASLDGAGFNRLDTGKSLAMSNQLTRKQAVLGRRIVLKYHRQLPQDLLATIRGAAR
jgi:hypothetical protein